MACKASASTQYLFLCTRPSGPSQAEAQAARERSIEDKLRDKELASMQAELKELQKAEMDKILEVVALEDKIAAASKAGELDEKKRLEEEKQREVEERQKLTEEKNKKAMDLKERYERYERPGGPK